MKIKNKMKIKKKTGDLWVFPISYIENKYDYFKNR
jgi:hypothetical protein